MRLEGAHACGRGRRCLRSGPGLVRLVRRYQSSLSPTQLVLLHGLGEPFLSYLPLSPPPPPLRSPPSLFCAPPHPQVDPAIHGSPSRYTLSLARWLCFFYVEGFETHSEAV